MRKNPRLLRCAGGRDGKALAGNPALVNLVQAEKWDGKLPATMVPGGALPMLNLPAQR